MLSVHPGDHGNPAVFRGRGKAQERELQAAQQRSMEVNVESSLEIQKALDKNLHLEL